ncbi:hypothetical protein H6G81_16870 [Scytonema hofmannii FACHB-248]|uniref:Uncharacterized protein n=1 Tax=Scytonema hofmannii FACHB-248 TaxID=1842502 RepID=A0ABR8GS12_9CYAN|nr:MULTISPECIES: hypothetical protein [Nostocales]MBD2606153.1 hypothetical protein [Scytonema hofmannii FACHB-248]
MNTKQSQKSPTTQKQQTQALWTELNDEVAAQLSGGGPNGPEDKTPPVIFPILVLRF